MGTSSGVRVPRGSDDRNHKPKATAPPRGGVGRKPEANPWSEEHEPRRRRGDPGESAQHDEARVIKGLQRKRGGRAGKVGALIRGDLPECRPRRKSPDTGRREAPVTRQESAEAVVRAGRRVFQAGSSPAGPIPSGVRSQQAGVMPRRAQEDEGSKRSNGIDAQDRAPAARRGLKGLRRTAGP